MPNSEDVSICVIKQVCIVRAASRFHFYLFIRYCLLKLLKLSSVGSVNFSSCNTFSCADLSLGNRELVHGHENYFGKQVACICGHVRCMA